jgi:hypothetical protein
VDLFYRGLVLLRTLINTIMKKNIVVFGLILGAILVTNAIIMMHLVISNPDFEGNDFVGYGAMVVVFSLVYFGVRNYRNKQSDGAISFGKAFRIGALIVLVASTLYVIVGLSYYNLFVPDFIERYVQYVLRHTSEASLAAKTKEMAEFREMYKNPLFAILLTYSEVLPIGLVVALVSALILKRRSKSLNTAMA